MAWPRNKVGSLIVIKIKRVAKFLITTIVVLAIASLAGQLIKYTTGHDSVFGLVSMFDLDKELSIPSFFSAIQLFIVGMLLIYIYFLRKEKEESDVLYWKWLSFIFVFLSIDEACSIHELLNKPTEILLNTSGVFKYPWTITYGAGLILFGCCFFKFITNLDKKTRYWMFLAFLIYVGGAIGMEMVSGLHTEIVGRENIIHSFITTMEETLEMIGVTVFLLALLDYLNRHYQKTIFKIVRK